MSALRTVFLLTLLTMVLVVVGWLVAGRAGMLVALGFGLVLNFVNFWFSHRIVLKVHGARVLAPGELDWLQEDVARMAAEAGLPTPTVAWIDKDAPNAFATGRSPRKAVVAVTRGLLQTVDRRGVRAILGHELAHVKNRDMLTMTLVAGAVSAIAVLAFMGRWGALMGAGRGRGGVNPLVLLVVSIVAPLVAMLVQLAISRAREYGADETGARISGDPAGLADALEALHRAIPRHEPLSRTGATAHMMIANPFFGMRGELMSTHPDPAKRIARLRAMAPGR